METGLMTVMVVSSTILAISIPGGKTKLTVEKESQLRLFVWLTHPSLVANPIINAIPPMISTKATPYAINSGKPILLNHPTMFSIPP
jgi:hypothetical protein